jgi:hypothetical protein
MHDEDINASQSSPPARTNMFAAEDISQMLRLPPAFARRILSCTTNRKIFMQMLIHTRLATLSTEDQVFAFVRVCSVY